MDLDENCWTGKTTLCSLNDTQFVHFYHTFIFPGFKYGRANQGPTPPVSPMSDIVDAADSSCNAGSSSSVFSPTPSAPESPAAAANDDRLKVRNSSDSFDSGYHPSASTPSSNGASASVAAGSNRTEDAVALYQRFVAPDCPEPGTNCIKMGLPRKLILRDYFQENMTSRRPWARS